MWLIASAISPACFGTTIIVLRQHGKIWIAADSLQFGQSSDGKTKTRAICKLVKQNGFYWADSGDIVEDDVSGFSLSGLLREIPSSGKNINQIANNFIAKAKQPALDELYSVKKLDPQMYAD